MSLDVVRGSAPLLPSLGSFSSPPHCLPRLLDWVSPTPLQSRVSCGQDALIQYGSRLGFPLGPKCEKRSARFAPTDFRIGKCQRISCVMRTDFVNLTPAAAVVCQCRCSREKSGRFEDSDTGSLSDPSVNCKGDNKRAGNGSGWMGMDFDVRDALKSRPCNGTGEGLRSGFFHDRASSTSWAQESGSFSCSAANNTPAGNERNVSRSGFNPTDELLVRHKASTAGIPMSLRMLKRKQVQNRVLRKGLPQEASDDACKSPGFLAIAGGSTYCSFKKAFSSMVFMIRELQSLTIHNLRGAFYDDLQEVLAVTHTELHSSFLWLFQQIFACTPKLMLAVMLLLANYTAYSMGNHVALSAVSHPSPVVAGSFDVCLFGRVPNDARPDSRIVLESSAGVVSIPVEARDHEIRDSSLSTQAEFSGAGGSSGPIVAVSGSSDGPRGESGDHLSRNGVIFSSQDRSQSIVEASAGGGSDDAQVAGRDAKYFTSSESLVLNRELKKRMVAPVHIKIAPDNYSCYDRTELIYEHAICSDPTNALLLANFAQFLFLVRHDHDRAEQLFRRAVKADPTDGDVITRFASFLWLACGDRLAAEKAYRAVVDMDPSNPYVTGCLANFLWHAGEGASCNICSSN